MPWMDLTHSSPRRILRSLQDSSAPLCAYRICLGEPSHVPQVFNWNAHSLRAHCYSQDIDPSSSRPATSSADSKDWEIYRDTDYAGNAEIQNKRRSQLGELQMLNGAPVEWCSKVSSVAFAHPDIGDAHSDTSSAASEIYGAANTASNMCHTSYVADEVGIDFPKPATLQTDNKAALAFTAATCQHNKLKHIDARQGWVTALRDKGILIPKRVPTRDNLADIFTKILPRGEFTGLRYQILFPLPPQFKKSF